MRLNKKLNESETQRLELISLSNRETFSFSAEIAKLRKELEKSEAIRQNLEMDCATLKSIHNKEKYLSIEKERIIQENTKFFEGFIIALFGTWAIFFWLSSFF